MFPAVAAGGAGGVTASTPDTTPPSGAPTSASAYTYGGTLVGVQWTNTDTNAHTELGIGADSTTDPTSVSASAAPGETTYETGTTTKCWWYVRHKRNGQASAWVYAPHGDCGDA